NRNPRSVAGRCVVVSCRSISLVLVPIRFRLALCLACSVERARQCPLFGGALIDVLDQPRAHAHPCPGQVHERDPLGRRRLVERGLDGLSHLTADEPIRVVCHDEEVVNRWLWLARSLEPLLGVLHGPLPPFAAALQYKSPRPVVRADGATRQRTQVPLRSIPFAPCTGAKTCVAAPRVAAGRLAQCLESIFDRQIGHTYRLSQTQKHLEPALSSCAGT